MTEEKSIKMEEWEIDAFETSKRTIICGMNALAECLEPHKYHPLYKEYFEKADELMEIENKIWGMVKEGKK